MVMLVLNQALKMIVVTERDRTDGGVGHLKMTPLPVPPHFQYEADQQSK